MTKREVWPAPQWFFYAACFIAFQLYWMIGAIYGGSGWALFCAMAVALYFSRAALASLKGGPSDE